MHPPRLAPRSVTCRTLRGASLFLPRQRVSRSGSRNAAEVISLTGSRTCGHKPAAATRHAFQAFQNTGRPGSLPRLPPRQRPALPESGGGSASCRAHRGAGFGASPRSLPGLPPHCVRAEEPGIGEGACAAGPAPRGAAPVGTQTLPPCRGAALLPAARSSSAGQTRRHADPAARCLERPDGTGLRVSGGPTAGTEGLRAQLPSRRRLAWLRLPFDRWHVPFPPRGNSSSLRLGGSPRSAGAERGAGGVRIHTPLQAGWYGPRGAALAGGPIHVFPLAPLPAALGGGRSRSAPRPPLRRRRGWCVPAAAASRPAPAPSALSLMLLFLSQEPEARPGPPPPVAAAAAAGLGPAPGMSVCGEAVGAGSLPSELVVHIFSFLAGPDRLRASAACSHWRECLFYPALWPRLRLSLRVSPAERPRLEFLMRKCGWFVRELRVQFAADNYPSGGGGAAAAGEGAAAAGDGEVPPLCPRWLDLLRTYLELVLCVLSSVRNNRYRFGPGLGGGREGRASPRPAEACGQAEPPGWRGAPWVARGRGRAVPSAAGDGACG